MKYEDASIVVQTSVRGVFADKNTDACVRLGGDNKQDEGHEKTRNTAIS